MRHLVKETATNRSRTSRIGLKGMWAGALISMFAFTPGHAHAATEQSIASGWGSITVQGTVISNPAVITSGQSADEYIPIWYFQRALNMLNDSQSYNPKTHDWDITVPGVDATLLDIPGGVGEGDASISINGRVVRKFTVKTAKDPAGGKHGQTTTFFPLYDLGTVLEEAGVLQTWDNAGFVFS